MGIMDMIQSLAGQTGAAAGTDQAKVAGGFIEALTQHPEGIQGVLDAFKNNGMADHVGAWGSGQAATATPDQVGQGLSGTGLIEKTAEKTGVSPALVSAALADRPSHGHSALRSQRPGYPRQWHGCHGGAAPRQTQGLAHQPERTILRLNPDGCGATTSIAPPARPTSQPS